MDDGWMGGWVDRWMGEKKYIEMGEAPPSPETTQKSVVER